jgi:hypothetical protein
MRWFKVAAIAVGVVVPFLVVASVIGFLLKRDGRLTVRFVAGGDNRTKQA